MIHQIRFFLEYISGCKFNLLSIYLFIFLSINLHSNFDACSSDLSKDLIINSDIQYRYALKLFEQKDFETAIVEFNRFIYFFSDDKRVKEITFKKGVALFHVKHYGEAMIIFKNLSSNIFDISLSVSGNFVEKSVEINNIDSDINIAVDSLFMLSNTFLALNRYASAEMVLQNFLLINNENDEPKREDKALYAVMLIYLLKAKDNKTSQKESLDSLYKAVLYIDKMTPAGKSAYKADYIKQKILQIIQTNEKTMKNPVIAGLLSIIPGGGFAYCNRYKDAIIAFLLNSAFILSTAESFEDGNSALGGLVGFVGFGFYGGSIYGGISSVHKHNKEIIKHGVDNINISNNPF